MKRNGTERVSSELKELYRLIKQQERLFLELRGVIWWSGNFPDKSEEIQAMNIELKKKIYSSIERVREELKWDEKLDRKAVDCGDGYYLRPSERLKNYESWMTSYSEGIKVEAQARIDW
jgi:hypothetical protein